MCFRSLQEYVKFQLQKFYLYFQIAYWAVGSRLLPLFNATAPGCVLLKFLEIPVEQNIP